MENQTAPTIQEARLQRMELERAIGRLVKEYTDHYGLHISAIDVEPLLVQGYGEPERAIGYTVRVTTELP